MALKIPADFDVMSQDLDANETFIRDGLKLDISNWAKFRYTIDIGNQASKLRSLGGTITSEVGDAYRELAKSHYEVVLSLGQAKLSQLFALHADQIAIAGEPRLLTIMKSLKDCYFHLGCLLDNVARLVYILNDPSSPTAKTRARGREVYMRHRIDWGMICERIKTEPTKYTGYFRYIRSRILQEVLNIRVLPNSK